MRQAIVFVFAISILSAAPPVRAGDGGRFAEWASVRSGELDRRWEQVTGRWAPSAGAAREVPASERGVSRPERAWTPSYGSPVSPLGAPGIGSDWTHTNLQFTRYTDGMLLLNSSRKRQGASRGVSTLTSPAAATRGNITIGRSSFDRNVRFTRTIHTKGRNFGSRMSAPLHGRVSRSSVTRTPSSLHGASRMRRQPSRGRW